MGLKKTGFAVGTAVTLSALLFSSAPANASTDAKQVKRLANYAAAACMESDLSGNIHAVKCSTSIGQQFTWAGVVNAESTFQNKRTGKCLDSDPHGAVYTLKCNGGYNQLWQVILPAAKSKLILKNHETHRCLEQNTTDGLYRTATCNANETRQRWSIG